MADQRYAIVQVKGHTSARDKVDHLGHGGSNSSYPNHIPGWL